MPIEPRELEGLLDRYWPVLVTWLGGMREEAEDCVQGAFIKLASEDPVPTHCVAWLFAVSRRLAINARISQSKRRIRESRVAAWRSEQEMSANAGDSVELREVLAKLNHRDRELVVARIWGELSFEELAELLGESKATVWREYQSAIVRLRHLMGDNDEDVSR